MVFQSTLPRGERHPHFLPVAMPRYFNPRSREGSDAHSALRWSSVLPISIHAPARGATNQTAAEINLQYAFQSTLPRGERREFGRFGSIFWAFQSTLPRGERPVGDMLHVNLGKFQSTLPRGERRLSNFSFIILICISIHAPARGATAEFVDLMTDMEGISIHAPARGATILFSITPTPLKNFNPRSREGSDVDAEAYLVKVLSFQSTLPRGERRMPISALRRL